MTLKTPVVLGNVVLSNGNLAVLAGNFTQLSPSSSYGYYGFDQLQVVVLSSSTPTDLNQTTGLTWGTGESPDNQFYDSGNGTGGGAITALSGGGMAVLTWGNPNHNYYLEILNNAGTITTAPLVVAGTGTGENLHGWIGSYSGGIDVAYTENDDSSWYLQRYTNTGTAVGSAITISPGSGYSVGAMAVDGLGDVLISCSYSDVYHYAKYIEYNSSGVVIASGTTNQIEDAQQWVGLPGGGFETVSYAPNAAWNPSLGYTGYNMTVQKLTAAGALSTLATLNNALSTPSGSGGEVASNLGINGAGTLYWQEATASGYSTTYDKLPSGSSTITRETYPTSSSLAFATTPASATTVTGVGVNASNQLVEETVGAACFAGGTRIATAAGLVAVETLVAGDRVCLARGGLAEVVWVGHRTVDCARHPRPWQVHPVRFAAGAIAAGVPAVDLLVSPDHAVFLDGVLIPAYRLINGATIRREAVARISYWHVELARHDVILAEGLACESYLDTGNRGAFANGGVVVQRDPDFSRGVWQAQGCAPLVQDGPERDAAHRRLLRRAEDLGHRLTPEAKPVIEVAGRRLAPERVDGEWQFVLPAGSRTVVLRSRVWVPAEVSPDTDDTRRLGLAVAALWLDNALIALNDARLGTGWHAPEKKWRWTDGAAEIDVAGAVLLSVKTAAPARYWCPTQGTLVLAA